MSTGSEGIILKAAASSPAFLKGNRSLRGSKILGEYVLNSSNIIEVLH